jgi:hypothetical protein
VIYIIIRVISIFGVIYGGSKGDQRGIKGGSKGDEMGMKWG